MEYIGMEQNKLRNISHLQNIIETTSNTAQSSFAKEIKVEPLVKRELSEREKVELGLKKWQKAEQKRVNVNIIQAEKEKSDRSEPLAKTNLKSLSLAFAMESQDDDIEKVAIFEKPK